MASYRSIASLIIGALMLVPLSTLAQADYPTRPIKLIVPVGAGGATDALARALSKHLGDELGQSIVVENRPGAASNVGADAAAKARPDGYTLLFGHIGIFSLNPLLYEKLSFDPQRDFVPIAPIAETGYVLITSPKLPVSSVTELVKHIKSHPGQVNFGSVGRGSVQHLAAELFKTMAGVEITSIPYNSPPQMKVDLAEGRVQMIFDNIVAARPLIENKTVRPLAVTSADRSTLLPDVPTLAESGYPGYRITAWFGLFAPSGVPQVVVDRVAAASAKVLKTDDFQKRLRTTGGEPMQASPTQFAKFISEENAKWAKIVRQADIKPQ